MPCCRLTLWLCCLVCSVLRQRQRDERMEDAAKDAESGWWDGWWMLERPPKPTPLQDQRIAEINSTQMPRILKIHKLGLRWATTAKTYRRIIYSCCTVGLWSLYTFVVQNLTRVNPGGWGSRPLDIWMGEKYFWPGSTTPRFQNQIDASAKSHPVCRVFKLLGLNIVIILCVEDYKRKSDQEDDRGSIGLYCICTFI